MTEELEYSGSDLDLQHEPMGSVQWCGHAFSPEMVDIMQAYHLKGDGGVREIHSSKISKAARESELREEQV